MVRLFVLSLGLLVGVLPFALANLVMPNRALAQTYRLMAEEIEGDRLQTAHAQTQIATRAAESSSDQGRFILLGEPGPTQLFDRAKLVRCSLNTEKRGLSAITRGGCEAPIYLEPRVEHLLPAGFYLLGYENSIFPGFVEIKAGELAKVSLQKIEVTAANAADLTGDIKIYRDLARLTEQRKVMASSFALAGNMFSVARYDFGDHYIRAWPMPETVRRQTFSLCENNKVFGSMPPRAARLCRMWRAGQGGTTHPFVISEFYQFNPPASLDPTGRSAGGARVFSIGSPGDDFPVFWRKQLVATPLQVGSFVSVLPGAYVIEGASTKDGKPIRKNYRTPGLEAVEQAGYRMRSWGEEASVASQILRGESAMQKAATEKQNAAAATASVTSAISALFTAPASEADENDRSLAVTCETAKLWKTEHRSWCSMDGLEGCARNNMFCEPLTDLK